MVVITIMQTRTTIMMVKMMIMIQMVMMVMMMCIMTMTMMMTMTMIMIVIMIPPLQPLIKLARAVGCHRHCKMKTGSCKTVHIHLICKQ